MRSSAQRLSIVMPSPTAIHESGHACIGVALGIDVLSASVVPNLDSGGRVKVRGFSDVDMACATLFLFAGAAATVRAYPSEGRTAWSSSEHSDIAYAYTLIRSLIYEARGHFGPVDSRHEDDVRAMWRTRTMRLISRYWVWILRTAQALDAYRHLTVSQVRALERP